MALPREARLAIQRHKARRVACVVCGTFQDIVRHHVYGRRASNVLVPMCKPCESATHGRTLAKPGTEATVLRYRRLLPARCVQRPLGTRPYHVPKHVWRFMQRKPRVVNPERATRTERRVRDALAESQPEVLAWLESVGA